MQLLKSTGLKAGAYTKYKKNDKQAKAYNSANFNH